MTYPEISEEDWYRMRELAAKLVDHHRQEEEIEEGLVRSEILDYLRELEEKYGPHPQIYDSIADYLTDGEDSLSWRLKAFEICMEKDFFERGLISRSIAQHFLYEHPDRVKAEYWFEKAMKNGIESNNPAEIEETDKLREEIRDYFEGREGRRPD